MTRERWLYYSGRLTEVRDVAGAMELYREFDEREGPDEDRAVGEIVSMMLMKAAVMDFDEALLDRIAAYNVEHGGGRPAASSSPANATPGPDRAQDGSAPRPGESLAWSEPAPAGRASREMR